jgi:hypothetical protein
MYDPIAFSPYSATLCEQSVEANGELRPLSVVGNQKVVDPPPRLANELTEGNVREGLPVGGVLGGFCQEPRGLEQYVLERLEEHDVKANLAIYLVLIDIRRVAGSARNSAARELVRFWLPWVRMRRH